MNFKHDHNLVQQQLNSALYAQKKLHVALVRSDQIHPQVSGNKWFKLKYAMLEAKRRNYASIISFGGAYSNHIHALAYAAHAMGIPTIGYIRGEWTEDNPTLNDARKWGMQLHSLSRADYREKSSAKFLSQLRQRYPNSLVIPEGGSGAFAVRGVNDLMADIEQQLPDLDYLVAACGTGGTLAGLLGNAQTTRCVLGIPVLKGAGFLKQDIEQFLKNAQQSAQCQWQLDLQGHYGGYGKVKADHRAIMSDLECQYDVELEPIYVAKMWRRFDELVNADYFKPGTQVALLHSGGLQGRRGFKAL